MRFIIVTKIDKSVKFVESNMILKIKESIAYGVHIIDSIFVNYKIHRPRNTFK